MRGTSIEVVFNLSVNEMKHLYNKVNAVLFMVNYSILGLWAILRVHCGSK